ncbi:hypothetical protein [Catenuloplanes japonicus]|uniref:hypothetical protein n=1 Tax=Catenuloplanes japonicus TaxID=33876 RepID=UPI00052742BE|nr:hypothetical protein [Catenuloplanes japonicus]
MGTVPAQSANGTAAPGGPAGSDGPATAGGPAGVAGPAAPSTTDRPGADTAGTIGGTAAGGIDVTGDAQRPETAPHTGDDPGSAGAVRPDDPGTRGPAHGDQTSPARPGTATDSATTVVPPPTHDGEPTGHQTGTPNPDRTVDPGPAERPGTNGTATDPAPAGPGPGTARGPSSIAALSMDGWSVADWQTGTPNPDYTVDAGPTAAPTATESDSTSPSEAGPSTAPTAAAPAPVPAATPAALSGAAPGATPGATPGTTPGSPRNTAAGPATEDQADGTADTRDTSVNVTDGLATHPAPATIESLSTDGWGTADWQTGAPNPDYTVDAVPVVEDTAAGPDRTGTSPAESATPEPASRPLPDTAPATAPARPDLTIDTDLARPDDGPVSPLTDDDTSASGPSTPATPVSPLSPSQLAAAPAWHGPVVFGRRSPNSLPVALNPADQLVVEMESADGRFFGVSFPMNEDEAKAIRTYAPLLAASSLRTYDRVVRRNEDGSFWARPTPTGLPAPDRLRVIDGHGTEGFAGITFKDGRTWLFDGPGLLRSAEAHGLRRGVPDGDPALLLLQCQAAVGGPDSLAATLRDAAVQDGLQAPVYGFTGDVSLDAAAGPGHVIDVNRGVALKRFGASLSPEPAPATDPAPSVPRGERPHALRRAVGPEAEMDYTELEPARGIELNEKDLIARHPYFDITAVETAGGIRLEFGFRPVRNYPEETHLPTPDAVLAVFADTVNRIRSAPRQARLGSVLGSQFRFNNALDTADARVRNFGSGTKPYLYMQYTFGVPMAGMYDVLDHLYHSAAALRPNARDTTGLMGHALTFGTDIASRYAGVPFTAQPGAAPPLGVPGVSSSEQASEIRGHLALTYAHTAALVYQSVDDSPLSKNRTLALSRTSMADNLAGLSPDARTYLASNGAGIKNAMRQSILERSGQAPDARDPLSRRIADDTQRRRIEAYVDAALYPGVESIGQNEAFDSLMTTVPPDTNDGREFPGKPVVEARFAGPPRVTPDGFAHDFRQISDVVRTARDRAVSFQSPIPPTGYGSTYPDPYAPATYAPNPYADPYAPGPSSYAPGPSSYAPPAPAPAPPAQSSSSGSSSRRPRFWSRRRGDGTTPAAPPPPRAGVPVSGRPLATGAGLAYVDDSDPVPRGRDGYYTVFGHGSPGSVAGHGPEQIAADIHTDPAFDPATPILLASCDTADFAEELVLHLPPGVTVIAPTNTFWTGPDGSGGHVAGTAVDADGRMYPAPAGDSDHFVAVGRGEDDAVTVTPIANDPRVPASPRAWMDPYRPNGYYGYSGYSGQPAYAPGQPASYSGYAPYPGGYAPPPPPPPPPPSMPPMPPPAPVAAPPVEEIKAIKNHGDTWETIQPAWVKHVITYEGSVPIAIGFPRDDAESALMQRQARYAHSQGMAAYDRYPRHEPGAPRHEWAHRRQQIPMPGGQTGPPASSNMLFIDGHGGATMIGLVFTDDSYWGTDGKNLARLINHYGVLHRSRGGLASDIVMTHCNAAESAGPGGVAYDFSRQMARYGHVGAVYAGTDTVQLRQPPPQHVPADQYPTPLAVRDDGIMMRFDASGHHRSGSSYAESSSSGARRGPDRHSSSHDYPPQSGGGSRRRGGLANDPALAATVPVGPVAVPLTGGSGITYTADASLTGPDGHFTVFGHGNPHSIGGHTPEQVAADLRTNGHQRHPRPRRRHHRRHRRTHPPRTRHRHRPPRHHHPQRRRHHHHHADRRRPHRAGRSGPVDVRAFLRRPAGRLHALSVLRGRLRSAASASAGKGRWSSAGQALRAATGSATPAAGARDPRDARRGRVAGDRGDRSGRRRRTGLHGRPIPDLRLHQRKRRRGSADQSQRDAPSAELRPVRPVRGRVRPVGYPRGHGVCDAVHRGCDAVRDEPEPLLRTR